MLEDSVGYFKLFRDLLAYVYVPVVQRELDIFRETIRNSHPGRKQARKELPCGVPDHIYHFLEEYGGERCSYIISEEQLMEVAELSGIFDEDDDFLDPTFRARCKEYIPNTNEIKPAQAANAYLYLKSHLA